MSKKLFFGLFAAAGLLLAASCSQDEMDSVTVASGEAQVTFTLKQPGLATRAYSEGKQATTLTYAIYDADNEDNLLDTQVIPSAFDANLTATLTLDLVTTKSYEILFWADAPSSPYTFNADADEETGATAQTITVDYTSLTSQDDSRDAFYGSIEIEKVSGAINETVELKRPFAQLNIGTTDYQDAINAGFTPSTTTITVTTPLYNTLNLSDGTVSNSDSDALTKLEFATADIPSDETFPVDGATYLAMNYILAAADKELADIEFTVNSAEGQDISTTYDNVPLQRNYRTNIYGALLTNPANFSITIDPLYAGDNNAEVGEHGVLVWDGTTITAPDYDEESQTYTITDGAELAWLAQQVNSGNAPSSETISSSKAAPLTKTGEETTSGWNVKLTADIDLGNHAWTPIGQLPDGESIADNSADYLTYAFAGTFDGNNKTIYNLNVTSSEATGLFGAIHGATIQNLTVEDATVTSNHWAGAIAGYYNIYTGGDEGMTITGCNVKNATITLSAEDTSTDETESYNNGDKAGGIIGFIGCSGTSTPATVSNCSVENSTITAYRDLGSIVGAARGSQVTISGNTATNVTVNADAEHDYNKISSRVPSAYNAAEILGRDVNSSSPVTQESNTATNVTLGVVNYVASSTSALKEALNDPDVKSVTVTSNVSTGAILELTTDKEITLNGTTLSTSNHALRIESGVSVTIKGGTVTASNVICYSGSSLTLEDVDMTVAAAVQVTSGTLVASGSSIYVTPNNHSAISLSGSGNTVIMEDSTVKTNGYSGIVQGSGTGYTYGTTVELTNVNIESPSSGIVLNNSASGEANTLTVNGGTITSTNSSASGSTSAIQVTKTNLTVKDATLVSNNATQSYNSRNGYGIVMIGHTTGEAYAESVELSGNTYQLAKTSGTVIKAAKYNGSGVTEADPDGTLEVIE